MSAFFEGLFLGIALGVLAIAVPVSRALLANAKQASGVAR